MLDIPIVINNRDRLTTTRNLVEKLHSLDYKNIHILDNGSTYPPLLKWYREIEGSVVVNQIGNFGQLAIYNSGYLINFPNHKWICYTDSDIQLHQAFPSNWAEEMIRIADKHKAVKIGCALSLDTLPDNQFTKIFKEWEHKYWQYPVEENVFSADVDTTFCLIQRNLGFQYQALRVAGNFTAKHIPWYTDFSNLSEEEKYYLDHVNIEYSGYKRYYNIHLNQ